MKIYKIRLVAKWAAKEGISDVMLKQAVDEMEKGIVDANLGSFLYKKRVAIDGGGKSGGTRIMIAFKKGDKAFFLYGFAKSKRANVNEKEEKGLKLLSKSFIGMNDADISKAIKAGELIEVKEK